MDDMRARYFKGELSSEERAEFEVMRDRAIRHLLEAPDDEMLSVSEVDIPAPHKARIYPTLQCQECKEGFMEVRGKAANAKTVCKECFSRMTGEQQ